MGDVIRGRCPTPLSQKVGVNRRFQAKAPKNKYLQYLRNYKSGEDRIWGTS